MIHTLETDCAVVQGQDAQGPQDAQGCLCGPEEECACYTLGKDSAFEDIRRVITDGNHSADCGRNPCAVVRAVLDSSKKTSLPARYG